jgi:chromosome partitioning protein
MSIITVVNQKGGSGKTTTAVNLAAALARGMADDQQVLLIDLDPQANTTAVFLGVPFAAGPQHAPVVYEILMERASVTDVVRRVTLPATCLSADKARRAPEGSLDILPAHLNLAAAELELVTAFERERRLARALAPILDRYHFVVVDCPPSLSLLTVNALMAATDVLIPVDPGLFPLVGLGILLRTVEMVRQSNSGLQVSGVLPTFADRTVLARDSQRQLRQEFGNLVLEPIPRRVALSEANAAGKDIFAYAPASAGAQAYGHLAAEVVRRVHSGSHVLAPCPSEE